MARTRLVIERDVAARMRDGTTLYADIYRPDGAGDLPVLLMRLPYDKQDAETVAYAHPAWYARHGYMVVVQDTRGRWRSEGEFSPFAHELEDGYDSVEWSAALPGSTGNVGMYGFSYVGATQLWAAIAQPPHLVCICPGFTSADYYDGWAYQGGALSLAFDEYWALYLATETARRHGGSTLESVVEDALRDLRRWNDALPLKAFPPLRGHAAAPYFFDWLRHERRDAYWRRWSVQAHYAQIHVPALHIAGWYDIFLDGTLRNFRGIREQSSSARARAHQRLIVGPWHHMPWSPLVGELDFGPAALNRIDAYQLRWFDHWLKGDDTGLLQEPPVRAFIVGEDCWRDFDDWPPPAARPLSLYLASGGRANSLAGDGSLRPVPPTGEAEPDIFVYDPRAPVPSRGGHSCCQAELVPMGPADQRAVEVRNDVLVYTSEPFAHPCLLAGAIELRLYAATTAPDTDWTAKLVDVHPDGRAININDGIIRARYRRSLERAELLEPERVYEYTIAVGAAGWRVAPGHRLRLEVSSSNFPMYDRNPNTGHPLGEDAISDLRTATQTVYHEQAYPSRVIIRIFES